MDAGTGRPPPLLILEVFYRFSRPILVTPGVVFRPHDGQRGQAAACLICRFFRPCPGAKRRWSPRPKCLGRADVRRIADRRRLQADISGDVIIRLRKNGACFCTLHHDLPTLIIVTRNLFFLDEKFENTSSTLKDQGYCFMCPVSSVDHLTLAIS